MVRKAEYETRVQRIQLIRREIRLAVPEFRYPEEMDAHGTWHNLQPFMRGGDTLQWAADIDLGLIPALKQSPDPAWHRITFYLGLLVQELNWLDGNYYTNCPRCF